MQNGKQNNACIGLTPFASGPVPPRPVPPPFAPAPEFEQAQPSAAPAAGMPRSVKLARITLIAPTALNLVLAVVALLQAQALLDSLTPYRKAWFAGAISSQAQAAQAGVTFAQLGLVWAVAHAAVAVALAVRAGRGGHAVRAALVVFGGWQCLLGSLALAVSGENSGSAVVRALIALAPGALLVCLATRPDAVAWFNRSRR
ncbi:hypothetical protein ACI1MP_37030 [Kitasatospora griseola]|uniref:hypothetical protein n=1 Tax=Kitasatospora griseola TaxID=2064 RepID=UPI003855F39A